MRLRLKQPSVLPGFGLTLGFTLSYLGLIVLLPLGALIAERRGRRGRGLAIARLAPVLAAFRVSFGTALAAAVVNAFFGLIVAWVLVRDFPGRRMVDSLIDLPFALPTAVAGIALTALYAGNGWLGQFLEPLGVKVAFTPLGIVVALIFIGLPFVVRTVGRSCRISMPKSRRRRRRSAPGAGRPSAASSCRRSCRRCSPASRSPSPGLGEYGSVIFIAGNMPMVSEIVPLLIVIELEQYDYAGATVVGTAMLAAAFLLLLAINLLQRWTRARRPDAEDPLMFASAALYRSRAVTADRPAVRALLIATALAFLGLFLLLLPLIAVFVEALRQGLGAYLAGITEPDALAAIRLTLLVAAIAVPLNLVFGIAAAWAIAKFEFKGKSLLTTLIDLPFSVSPVVAG